MAEKSVLFENLLMILQKEVRLYDAVLESVESERRALLSHNIDSLTRTTEKKDSLVFQIQDLERERDGVVRSLAEFLGRPAHGMRLGELSQAADASHGSKLEDCQRRLLSATKSISKIEEQNRKLINHSLGRVRASFAFLQQLTAPGVVYHPTGKMNTSDRGGRVLSNEI